MEALWSQFEHVMAKDDREGEGGDEEEREEVGDGGQGDGEAGGERRR